MSIPQVEQDVGLGALIGQGVSTGLQGLMQQHRQTKEQEKVGTAMGELTGRPDLSKFFSKLPINAMVPIAKELFTSQREEQKVLPAQLEKQQKKAKYAGVADKIEELAQPGLKGRTPFTAQGRERAAEINSLGEQMFAAVRDDIIKGNMNQKVFDFLKQRVTASASDTNATIQGKLNGFRQIVGLGDYANLTKGDVDNIIKTNVRMAKSQTGEVEQKGKRTVLMTAPDGSEARVPYNSDVMKAAIKQGAKIQRGK